MVGCNKRSALHHFYQHPAQCPLVIAPYASFKAHMENGAKQFLDNAARQMVAPVREKIDAGSNLTDELILAVLLAASSILFEGFYKSHENQIGIVEFMLSLKNMPELCRAITGDAVSTSEIEVVLTAAWEAVLAETQGGLPFLMKFTEGK